MRSTSSMVKETLSHLDAGVQFTSESLYATLCQMYGEGVSRGGVSGALAKAPGVELVGKEGRLHRYLLARPSELSNWSVRETSGAGGGHSGPRKSRKPVPTRESLKERLLAEAEQLLEIAAELESITAPLSNFSTSELLAELTSRAKEKKE